MGTELVGEGDQRWAKLGGILEYPGLGARDLTSRFQVPDPPFVGQVTL